MAHFAKKPPFTTRGEFVVVRAVTINGRDYKPGEPLAKDGLSDRLIRNLYDLRKIDMVDPDADVVPASARPVKAVKPATPKAEAKAATTDPDKPKYRVKQAGLGGFKVLDPNGQPIGPGHKTHAEALAEAERLNAA